MLIVGFGGIGRRHLANLRSLGVDDISVVEPEPASRHAAESLGAHVFEDLPQALADHPTGVLVCTPPAEHLEAAVAALDAGSHVFVEKPISHAVPGVAELIERAGMRRRALMVGYNWRFHAAIRRLKELIAAGAIGRVLHIRAEFGQYLPDWRPGRDYRATYTAGPSSQGGGILLDASHEIDYVMWLAGNAASVTAETRARGGLEMHAEDTAALTLALEDGVLAEIHVDCVRRGYARNCAVVGAAGTLTWDYAFGVDISSPDGRSEREPIVPDINEMYVEEMRHFLDCVRGHASPAVSGEDGLRVLRVVDAARNAAACGRRITVEP